MKTVKNSLSVSKLFLILVVASMTTFMFSSCTKDNFLKEEFEQRLDITGVKFPKFCPEPGEYTITKGHLHVENKAKTKNNGILSIKGSIKSNEIKLVDNNGDKYLSKEVISWNVKVGETEQSASFRAKFTLKSMDEKLIKLILSVKFNPAVENSFEVVKAELEGTNVPCLTDILN